VKSSESQWLAARRTAIAREADGMVNRACALLPSDWDKPTRCTSWTVRDLLRHVVEGISLYTEGLTRMAHGATDLVPASSLVKVGSTPREVCSRLAEGRQQLGTALTTLTPEVLNGLFPHRFFLLPGHLALDIVLMEEGMHHNDLAWALGDQVSLPGPVATAAFGYASARALEWAVDGEPPSHDLRYRLIGKTVRLELMWRDGRWTVVRDDARPDCELRGQDSALALFLYGRLSWTSSRLSVTGDKSLAGRFKAFLPGP